MKTKFLSALVALCMVLTLLPISALAVETTPVSVTISGNYSAYIVDPDTSQPNSVELNAYNITADTSTPNASITLNVNEVTSNSTITALQNAMSSSSTSYNKTSAMYFSMSLENVSGYTSGDLPENGFIEIPLKPTPELERAANGKSLVLLHFDSQNRLTRCDQGSKPNTFKVRAFSNFVLTYVEDTGSFDRTYDITVRSATGGTVTANRTSAYSDTQVILTVNPNSGYMLYSLAVTTSTGKNVPFTRQSNGTYTFTMPDSSVTVTPVFTRDDSTNIWNYGTAGNTNTSGWPYWYDDVSAVSFANFVDVPADAWYTNAVRWAVGSGITTGTSSSTFSPNDTCTRAQMVTFLWRAAGSPKTYTATNPFTDVEAGSYYYDAVLWAVSQGITTGTTATTFGPEVDCTRAQAVTFLFRASGNYAASGTTPFADVADSAYYHGAVAWAVAHGITTGTAADTFSPDNVCTRAEIVTFLYRDRA